MRLGGRLVKIMPLVAQIVARKDAIEVEMFFFPILLIDQAEFFIFFRRRFSRH